MSIIFLGLEKPIMEKVILVGLISKADGTLLSGTTPKVYRTEMTH